MNHNEFRFLRLSGVGSRFDEGMVKQEVHMFSKIFGQLRTLVSHMSPSKIFGKIGRVLDDMSWGEFIFTVALVGGACLMVTGMKMFDYHTQIAALQ